MSNLLKLTIILTKAKVADIATRRLLSFGDKMIKQIQKAVYSAPADCRRFLALTSSKGTLFLYTAEISDGCMVYYKIHHQ